MVDITHPLNQADVSIAHDWNLVETNRRMRRRKVARLKEQQRLADTSKWAGRHSRSAKMQVAAKQALKGWFEAARKDLDGMAVPVLVDAIITLGLNHDVKQVQRTVSSGADTVSGLLTLNGFTAALMACCATGRDRDRLLRLLQGEKEWPTFKGASKDRRIKPSTGGATETSAESAGLPTFVTQLAVYRRKVLMATVADKFPTPCTATFWTPDCDQPKQRDKSITKACVAEQAQKRPSPINNRIRAPANNSVGNNNNSPELKEGCEHVDLSPTKNYESSIDEPGSVEDARAVSNQARRQHEAVSECLFLARERSNDPPAPALNILEHGASSTFTPRNTLRNDNGTTDATNCRPRSSPAPGAARNITGPNAVQGFTTGHGVFEKCSRHVAQEHGRPNWRQTELCGVPGSMGRGVSVTGKSDEMHREETEAVGSNRLGDDAGCSEVLKETAKRLRDSMQQQDLHLAKKEARWIDYKAMKRRWWRRTPMSILLDDELDEDNRSYSRLSKPGTIKGTGWDNRRGTGGSARKSSSRFCSASTCRPNTAPVGSAPDSSLAGTTATTTTKLSSAASSTFRRPWEAISSPPTLGPIQLDENAKLPYPLLQLKRERAARVRRGEAVRDEGEYGGRASQGLRGVVEIPVMRGWKGGRHPHLVQVPYVL